MPIKTWVTHPKQKFDSYYYYDTDTRKFVRIRLELHRADGGRPSIMPDLTHYVGFVPNPGEFLFRELNRWSVKDGQIIYQGDKGAVALSKEPQIGLYTVDFSLPEGQTNPTHVHHGNAIISEANADLPWNSHKEVVTTGMLYAIAERELAKHNPKVIRLGLADESTEALGDEIFTLYGTLDVQLDKRDFFTQLKEGNEFFGNQELPETGMYLLQDNPYADKDGLIEFIIGAELVQDPVITKNLAEIKKYLIALTSIVTDYVNRYAEAYGKDYKTDAELWSLAMSNIPLLGPSKIDKQSYTRHIKGVTIAADFVSFVLDIVTGEGSAALNKFSTFLEKQGDALRAGVDSKNDYYNTIAIGICIEVTKVGEEIVYIPKIKQYKVKFDRANTTWSASCASVEFVDINFEYEYAVNVFDYEALEDAGIRKEFEQFIQKQRKAQIDKSTTFFNGDFPVKPPKLSPQYAY
jgi:hypothetical protein